MDKEPERPGIGERIPAGLITVVRWPVLGGTLVLLREISGTGSLQPGDFIGSVPSDLSRALYGVGIVFYTLLAVTKRRNDRGALLLSIVETGCLGVLVLWPTLEQRLASQDQGVFPYRELFAIWLAGSLLGFVSAARAHRRQLISRSDQLGVG